MGPIVYWPLGQASSYSMEAHPVVSVHHYYADGYTMITVTTVFVLPHA